MGVSENWLQGQGHSNNFLKQSPPQLVRIFVCCCVCLFPPTKGSFRFESTSGVKFIGLLLQFLPGLNSHWCHGNAALAGTTWLELLFVVDLDLILQPFSHWVQHPIHEPLISDTFKIELSTYSVDLSTWAQSPMLADLYAHSAPNCMRWAGFDPKYSVGLFI